MKITTEDLERWGACKDGILWFKRHFGSQCTVEEFVKQGKKDRRYGYIAWMLAQDVTLTRELIEAGAWMDVWSGVALRSAASKGNTDVVRMLLKTGANVHSFEDESLIMAARMGNEELVGVLIEAGADIQTWGRKVLSVAQEGGHEIGLIERYLHLEFLDKSEALALCMVIARIEKEVINGAKPRFYMVYNYRFGATTSVEHVTTLKVLVFESRDARNRAVERYHKDKVAARVIYWADIPKYVYVSVPGEAGMLYIDTGDIPFGSGAIGTVKGYWPDQEKGRAVPLKNTEVIK